MNEKHLLRMVMVMVMVMVVVVMVMVMMMMVMVMMIMAYTAAFPQIGSSSARIRAISASDRGQAAAPPLFSRSDMSSLKSPILG